MSSRIRIFSVTALGIFAVAFFFRLTVRSGFTCVPGDVWDGRLLFAIVDHWRQFFSGECAWNDMRMFWPVENTLAYSDTFFLQGVPYTLLCAMGVDRLLAYTLVFMMQAYAGYLSMYWLLKRFFAVPWLLAAAFAALFINLASMQLALDGSHLQLFIVWLGPLFVCLAWKSLEDVRRGWMWACAAAALLSGMFFSSYYETWFMVFFFCVAACVWGFAKLSLPCASTGGNFVGRVSGMVNLVRSRWLALCAFALTFAVTIIPFLMLYLPAARLFGRKSFADVRQTLPGLIDFINVSDGNLFWGWYARSLQLSSREWSTELNFGMTPLVMVLFAVVTFALVRAFFRRRPMLGTERVALLAGATVFVLWVMLFRWGNDSAWYFVLKLVPGANAMRVVFRINLFLAFPVVVVCAVGVSPLFAKGGAWRTALLAVLAVLFVGQYCTPWVHGRFCRSDVYGNLPPVAPVPSDAKAFYIIPRQGDDSLAMLANQITALIVAGRCGLPTINGYSGQFPSGWMLDACGSRYYGGVSSWLARYGVDSGVYGLDMETGTWRAPEFHCEMLPWEPGRNIVERGIFEKYGWLGWSNPENWGVWSDGKRSELVFSVPQGVGDLRIQAEFHGYVPRGHVQNVTMLVNGAEVGRWTIQAKEQVRADVFVPSALIPDGALRVTFLLPDSISPREVEKSGDGRCLGMGMLRFVVLPAEP